MTILHKLSKDKIFQDIYVFLETPVLIYKANTQLKNSFITESKLLNALLTAILKHKWMHGLLQILHFHSISITPIHLLILIKLNLYQHFSKIKIILCSPLPCLLQLTFM